jgi:hypothetical protein
MTHKHPLLALLSLPIVATFFVVGAGSTLANDAPNQVSFLSPAQNADWSMNRAVPSGNIKFDWNSYGDPEGDALWFYFYLMEWNGSSWEVAANTYTSGQGDTDITRSLSDGIYAWQVAAIDASQDSSPWYRWADTYRYLRVAGSGGSSGSGTHPNEPEGFSPITETSLPDLPDNGWGQNGGEAKNYLYPVNDSSDPISPGSAVEFKWNRGDEDGWGPGGKDVRPATLFGETFSPDYKKLYIDTSIWFHPDFDFNDNLTKLWFIPHNGIDGHASVFPMVWGNKNSNQTYGPADGQSLPAGAPSVYIQGVHPPTTNTYAGANLTNYRTTLAGGEWHRWEIVIVMNDPGYNNGEIHQWVDGKKVGEAKDFGFIQSGDSAKWEGIRYGPIYGGGANNVANSNTRFRVGHYYVSGSN